MLLLNRCIFTGTVGAGLKAHHGLYVGAICLRNIEDCFNSDLFQDKSFTEDFIPKLYTGQIKPSHELMGVIAPHDIIGQC
ncbi:hypothetical protein AV530_008235 [Patagioenas fasciata monilis]|uniref:Uncharacterized protein n=1 Tax=Patagioenas fasciata monilis TaxID=372326 RepID=A0A1V4KV17_PATFA|nr:hypothetical protein AV530_008235 [Patagioenas fasciata monilis]